MTVSRKLHTIIIVIIVAFSLAACGGNKQPGNMEPDDKQPGIESQRSFILENLTSYDEMHKLSFVTLYENGAASLGIPPISSYMPEYPLYYTQTEKELLIHYDRAMDKVGQTIPMDQSYRGDLIARFEIIDNDTLIFAEDYKSLFADVGSRYVYTP